MSSIIVPLIGGLGNQMFQYAAARALALRTGLQLELELSWFGIDPNRQYALTPFSIEARTTRVETRLRRRYGLLDRIVRRLPVARKQNGVPVFKEASFRYDRRIEKVQTSVFLEGYFQSEIYFREFRQQIIEDFKLRHPPAPAAAQMLNQIGSTEAICVHIRRGDYVSNTRANAHHGLCSLDYYEAGLTQMALGLANPHCFVFSDDPEWVRANLVSSLPTTIVDIHGPNEAHEDMRLMAACQRFVIANSSLSWWAAWLGEHGDKKVVAPAQWFQKRDIDTTDLLPSSWIRL